jgi:hypothetical protein
MVFPGLDGQLVPRLSAATLSFFIALHNLDPGKAYVGPHSGSNPNKQWFSLDRAAPVTANCAPDIASL